MQRGHASRRGRILQAIVVCPNCHGPLAPGAEALVCKQCGGEYRMEDKHPVLMVPGDARFEDAPDCCLNENEARTNAFTVENYYLPLLRRLIRPDLRAVRLLSVGCGVGVDVDLFREAGLEAFGVDCGSRLKAWSGRRHPYALHMGSVTHLPYPDGAFDVVITGCLLPHIGVVGDTVTGRATALGTVRFNGTFRVYGVEVTIDENGRETIQPTLVPE